MMMTTAPPARRVIKCPNGELKKPPRIIAIPAPVSPSATRLLTNSGAGIPILPNQPDILSGGSGNFPYPCMKKEIPRVNLSSQGAKGVRGFAIESRVEFRLAIDASF